MKFSRTTIAAKRVCSLMWHGDALIDWVGGGELYHLDGKHEESRVFWAFPFDAAQGTADHEFVVLYKRAGTKALLLRDGKILRELNRSFYHAHAYEYPICIWKTPQGRALIAHCPDNYCQIDIEDAATGERLTAGDRKPADFFHSRLAVNPSGTRLLSAGWIWHPWSSILYYEIDQALRNPVHLDPVTCSAPNSRHVGLAEESSACWQTDDRVLLGASDELEEPDELQDAKEPRLRPLGIAIYDVAARSYIQSVVVGEPLGTMMPLGSNYAVCFYKHPKVVSLESGEIIARWEDLKTGEQTSSIIWDLKIPPVAMDVKRQRFAVFGSDAITVIQIEI